jgi:hypothetical protein
MGTREQKNQPDALSKNTEAKPFRMLSIYDSDEANREALLTSELVLRELGDSIEADRTTWDLHALEASAIRDLAAEEAARADVIVVAMAGDQPSKALKEWTSLWEQKRELSGGLLALIPAGETSSGGDLADFLYETAVTANMDFLCQRKRRA